LSRVRPGNIDVVLLGVAVISVSTAAILVRLSNVHGFAAATWRLSLSSFITLSIVLAYREERRALRLDRVMLFLALGSGVALALHFDLWMLSLSFIGVAPSVAIVDSYPGLLALLGYLFLGERYSKIQIAGAFLAMLGVSLMSFHATPPSSAVFRGDSVIGVLLALGGMIAVSIYFLIGRKLRRHVSTWVYTFYVYSFAAITSLLLSVMLGVRLYGFRAEQYMYLVLLAVIPMMGGHTVLNYLLKKFSLLAVTVPVLGEPIGASILAWIILGEAIDVQTALYMAVILLGITLTVQREARRL